MSDGDDFAKLLASANSGASLDSLIPKDLGEDAIRHADDAVDFEGEDELADDDEEPVSSARVTHTGDGGGGYTLEAEAGGVEVEPSSRQSTRAAKGVDGAGASSEAVLDEVLLDMLYPGFKPNSILKMNALFGPKSAKYAPSEPRAVRACVPHRLRPDAEIDQRAAFKSQNARPQGLEGVVTVEESISAQPESEQTETNKETSEDREELVMATADWDYVLESSGDDLSEPTDMIQNADPKRRKFDDVPIHMDELYLSGDEDAILEGTFQGTPVKVQINMNDPYLLFANDRTNRVRQRLLQSRYNISNDRAYDLLKENYQNKVRSTIGNLTIDHSLVALRLQSPFYKVRLTKSQMRSWHRPKFTVKPNTVINFTPIKSRKKKKDKGKSITELLARTSDLTLGDNAPVFCIEYSEEFPLVLSNLGMGSKLINYYRKRNADDSTRPKRPLGETHVLDVQDRSAFWNFGFVEPGNVVPTLYNQMIRAPVFQHTPNKTDFLVIRSASKARGTRYFIRPIPYLFVAGQTYPVTLIPGPHSRKVTTASKNRLKMIVYRVLNKDGRHRLQVRDISSHFPDQNDMQNRQRLKEFMEYQRSGEDQGYWKIKQADTLPSEQTIRSMVVPEDIALLEAMQVGQQRLEDAGYGKTVEDDKMDDEGMSLEEQLAPWNISRNFINAIQGKAMLQLHGYGDPTARGEAFSFLRTSMKGGFKAMNESGDKGDKSKLGGHSYNVALQQKAYDEEIKRIWYSQAKSLRITESRSLPAEAPKVTNGSSTPAAAVVDSDDAIGVGSHQKVLKITRLMEDTNGIKIRKTEIVTDPNVIRAYLIRRRAMEDAQMAAHDIVVTNDEDRNRRNRKILEEELARLKRNQDRRMARKATKGDGKPGTKVKSTTRKCATCGAVGHIKTNKSCPMYNDIYMGGQGQGNSNVNVPAPAVGPSMQ